MKLTVKTEYACLALIELAENYCGGLVKISDISARRKIPRKFLENILLALKTSGYLVSKRGSYGGYKLAKSPDRITLAEIIRLMDGPLAPVESVSRFFYRHTPIEGSPRLISLFKEIRDFAAEKLEHTTLADLL